MSQPETAPSNFIKTIVERDLAAGRHEGAVHTRFPPEPNGYLHIGHAKAICLDFGIAADYGGACNLRFDDTNPLKEEQEYIDAIKEDVRWLGFDWQDREFHAADYFEQLYAWAELLITKGKAYVDDLSADEIRQYRGTLTEPGRNSPHRNRSVEENLDLLRRMRAGEFPDGARVLRAKIDMAAGNLNMRDPVMYRILHATHPRSGDAWCIYPTYDFTHGQSDSIEGITHSLCTLEFEDHRPLYDWFIEELGIFPSKQYEFARLNISYTMLSKRRLKQLVDDGLVDGWDDPRMPTLSGMRRRGYTPEAIRDFCDRIGVAKANSTVDVAFLEHCLRQDLNRRAERRMGVLNPLKVVIENYPEDQDEQLEAINNPEDPDAGSRLVPFSRELWIEAEDFREEAPRKYFRLAPARELRLRYGYFITCTDVIKDDSGTVIEIRCTHDPETRGGQAPDGRKVRGTIHWVSARHAVDAEVRLYDHLFTDEQPGAGSEINPESRQVLTGCKMEPALAVAAPGDIVQFERRGYFCRDIGETDRLIFNRAVGLRDTWAKIQKQQKSG
jgi:glutaminyl-tRNA synthetase